MFKFSKKSLQNLYGIHPDLSCVIVASLYSSKWDFSITEGVRNAERQSALYKIGRVSTGQIITNADGYLIKSNHQTKEDGFGHAVDLYPYHSKQIQFVDIETAKRIGQHIKQVANNLQIKIIWGGDWQSLKDYGHFELA
jgi:peptidoglycan L-alanyl-D-glutamate endopeptidase CwlK